MKVTGKAGITTGADTSDETFIQIEFRMNEAEAEEMLGDWKESDCNCFECLGMRRIKSILEKLDL